MSATFICNDCGNIITTEITEETTLLPPCCFHTVLALAQLMGLAAAHQCWLVAKKKKEEESRLLDKIADTAIVSPDPEVRAAAVKYREQRGRKDGD